MKVLGSAVKLWLRSQLSGIEGLDVAIMGNNRDLLGGYIPQVSLSTQRAIYQGLHLTQATVVAKNIHVNMGQILKGQPLRLLEPIAMTLQVQLTQRALQSSLSSPLFNSALKDLLRLILTQQQIDPDPILRQKLIWEQLTLQANCLTIKGWLQTDLGRKLPLSFSTGAEFLHPSRLRLYPLHVDFPPYLLALVPQQLELDLGEEAQMEELSVLPGLICCRGSLLVKP